MQRLGVYMLEGLVARLASLGSPIYKALRCKEPTSIEIFSTCTCFMKSVRTSCSDVEIKHLNVQPREPLTVNFALILDHIYFCGLQLHLALDQGSHSLKTSMRYQVDLFLTSMGSCNGCQDEDFSAPIKEDLVAQDLERFMSVPLITYFVFSKAHARSPFIGYRDFVRSRLARNGTGKREINGVKSFVE
ncbi:hypothetical protein FXO38_01922 [Capsicum annuum]|nr:hypothetical protein FXO38_01922 [Capsicum annuum]